MTSILQKYHRNPKIYIKLPSGSSYYPEELVKLTTSGELAVRAMTAHDEMILKNPDALLNGDAINKIVESCAPEIKDANQILAPDIEAILLAIHFASYGNSLNFEAECPACNHLNSFETSISSLIETTEKIEPPYVIEGEVTVADNKKEKIQIYVRPFTHAVSTKAALAAFEQAKIIQVMTADQFDDEKKLSMFNTSFEKMSKINFETISECIEKIVVREGVVTDQAEISAFISDVESGIVHQIRDKIKELNAIGTNNKFSAKCQKCEHEWQAKVEFNHASFFALSSKR